MKALSLLSRGYLSKTKRVVLPGESVPLTPSEAQYLLTKSLELPLPTSITEAVGIFQSDIILRTALVAAIADMRANPWVLDYVFASLPRDTLTMRDYGEPEVARAKEWFKKTDIKVLMSPRISDGSPPPVCVTIQLLSSEETENTLSDVHYQPTEDAEAVWPALSERFDPVNYSVPTGIMQLPASVVEALVVAPGMTVLDRTGTAHEILDVVSRDTISIKPGTVADFHDCFIKGAKPSMVAMIESVSANETYAIGCHCVGEALHLTYLHSIIVFALLKYRETLLEARGLERTAITSSDFKMDAEYTPEAFFSRYIKMSGFVRQSWPKSVAPAIQAVSVAYSQSAPSLGIRVIGGDKVPKEPGMPELDELMWSGDKDSLG